MLMKKLGKETKRKIYRGSVLFTVLVVMVVMLILTIATISLAGEASRRAYSNYFDHQTTSTARSVVDSVIEALKEDKNKDLAVAILNNVEAAGEKGIPVDISYGPEKSKNLGDGLGTVSSLVFTYVGKDQAPEKTGDKCYYITGSKKDIIKVTATVVQGGVTNTYSQYVIGDTLKSIRSSSGGGLIALGGYSGSGSPQLHAMSPAYIGIADDFDIYDNNKNSKLVNFTDDTKMNSAVINSSFVLNTNPFVYLTKGDGISIMGNFEQYNTLKLDTNYTPQATDSIKDYPYIYVKGAYKLCGEIEAGSDSNPVNIYCGRFLYGESGKITNSNANIYCYNTFDTLSRSNMYDTSDVANYAKSSWSQLGNSATDSKLIDWVRGATLPDKFKTGNFCTSGNLYMLGKVDVSGDVYVGGDLYIDGFTKDPIIGGKIYVNGKVRVKDTVGLDAGYKGRFDKLNGKICCNDDIKYYSTDASGVDVDGVDVDKLFQNPAAPVENKDNKFVVYDVSKMTLSPVITAFTKGDLKDLSEVVVTTEGVKKSMYDEKGGYKDAINKSEGLITGTGYYVYKGGTSGVISATTIDGTAAADGVIKADTVTLPGGKTYGYKAKITESCMLTGNFENINFYVEPSGTDKLWINLHNVVFSGCNFVIDDSKAEIIFYLPTDSSQINEGTGSAGVLKKYEDHISAASTDYTGYDNYVHFKTNTIVMSKEYLGRFLSESPINLKKYPLKDGDSSNDWMLPAISICAADKANVLYRTSDGFFTFTGDVCIPGGTVDVNKGGFTDGSGISNAGLNFKYPETLQYEDLPITKPVGCFGSIIAGSFQKLSNEFDTYYIDNPADDEPVKVGDGGYAWTPIPGYANF